MAYDKRLPTYKLYKYKCYFGKFPHGDAISQWTDTLNNHAKVRILMNVAVHCSLTSSTFHLSVCPGFNQWKCCLFCCYYSYCGSNVSTIDLNDLVSAVWNDSMVFTR